jgi:hypothetical protein
MYGDLEQVKKDLEDFRRIKPMWDKTIEEGRKVFQTAIDLGLVNPDGTPGPNHPDKKG